MLKAIVSFSLRFRGVMMALGFLFLGTGLYHLVIAKYDVFPEFAPPQIEIQAESPGLAPEQVEALVTQRIENVINGVPGLDTLRSSSVQGLSLITLILQADADVYHVRQTITERLSTLSGILPQGVTPEISPATSSTGDLIVVGLTSQKQSLMNLRTIADWEIRQRLLAVPGVAKVSVFGGDVQQFQVQIDPKRMVHFDLSVTDLLASVRQATGVRGAGFIDTPNQRLIIKTEGQSLTAAALAQTVLVKPLLNNGFLGVTLGDVAHVTVAPRPAINAASVNGTPGVVINVWAQLHANTLITTQALEKALGELTPSLTAQGITVHPRLFRAANFIEIATHNLQTSLILGAILVILVLTLFLRNMRTAAISCTAIPLSLLGSVIVLNYLGLTLNTMTLGGLAIAIGEVVDDAVIDVENILRRLRENWASAHPQPALTVVFNASIEVRSAVVYATSAVVLVFLPLLTLSGVAGRIFAPLGIAYIAAIITSLLIALTLTPAMCLLLLREQDTVGHEPAIVHWLRAHYRSVLQMVNRHTRRVVGGVVGLTLIGIIVFPFFETIFLPDFQEGHYILHMTAVPGTSLAESLRIGTNVTHALLEIPGVRSVAQRVGRAAADDVYGTHSGEIEIDLKPMGRGTSQEVQPKIFETLSQFTGVSFVLNTFLAERINETLSGYTAPVVVNVFGQDLDAIDKSAQEIAGVLSKITGASGVVMQSPPGTPQLSVRLRPSVLAHWGLEPVQVLEAVQTAYEGTTVGEVYEGNRSFDVSVILDPKIRNSVTAVGSLLVRSPTGVYVPLHDLAEIHEVSGRYVVLHSGARRVQTITCNVVGHSVDQFVKAARLKIQKQVQLSKGTYVDFAGSAQEQARSRADLAFHALLALVGIMILLSFVTGCLRNLTIVLANLPFAFVGGVAAVAVTGGSLSLGSLIGFITLFGITLRNSIMMMSHYDHLVTVDGLEWNFETAVRGASERLIPILITALVTALGLLPLAIMSGTAGREVEGPMAIIILGGLVTSTVLNLLVLPTLASRYARFQKQVTH